MTLFRWRDSLSVGVEAVDDDHKTLIDLLNRLHYMKLAGDDAEAIGHVLDELVRYTEYHFAREESLMRTGGYPDLDRHRKLHRELAHRLDVFRALFARDPEGFDVDSLYEFLSEWLLVHVSAEDSKLTPYIQGRQTD